MFGRLAILLTVLAVTVHADGEADQRPPEARLLVLKKVNNKYLVENRDVAVSYELFNIGDATAVSVRLNDKSFPSLDFVVVSGSYEAKFDKIAPGSNVSHSLVVKPNKFGLFNFTAAEVTYQLGEDNKEVRVAFTTEPGQGGIMPEVEFERRFSPHYLDWGIFFVMCWPSLGIPLMLWHSSKSKYEALLKKSK